MMRTKKRYRKMLQIRSLTGYGGVREPDAYLRIVRTVVRTGLDVHQGLLGHRQRV